MEIIAFIKRFYKGRKEIIWFQIWLKLRDHTFVLLFSEKNKTKKTSIEERISRVFWT